MTDRASGGNGADVLDGPTDEHILATRADLGSLETDLETGEGEPVRVMVDVTAIRHAEDGREPITLVFTEGTFGDRKLSPAQAWRLAQDLDIASTFVGQRRQDAGFDV